MSNDIPCKETSTLNPYEVMIGQYTDGNITMMNNVHDYIMNNKPEKDFGDEMWIHNCFNEDLKMRYKESQVNNALLPESNLIDKECMRFKRYMNAKVYMNLLKSDSIVKEGKDYSFAMLTPCRHDRFLTYADE